MEAIDIIRVIAEEFADIEDLKIEQWIEIVRPMVSRKQFGKLYEQAIAYLVCHKMKMAGLGQSALGGLDNISNAFTAQSISDGGSSISFASAGQGNTQRDAEYAMTPYGSQFLQLRKMVVVPIHVSGEDGFHGGL